MTCLRIFPDFRRDPWRFYWTLGLMRSASWMRKAFVLILETRAMQRLFDFLRLPHALCQPITFFPIRHFRNAN